MREKANYKETLDFLYKLFNGKIILTITDVATTFHIRHETAKKKFHMDKHGIEITKLASRMCDSSSDVNWR